MQIHLVKLNNVPIFQQLELEEALLRTDDRSFFILNTGSPLACVLGISSKVEQMLYVEKAQNVPLIRRFSGGGTVIVDENTVFSTFILHEHHNPDTLHRFAATFFTKVFDSLPFSFHQNDYRLQEKKIGGNAQYFTKGRSLHHTSFLYDWDKERMNLLKMPPKMPAYRENREHEAFLTPLKGHFESKQSLLSKMETTLRGAFDVVDIDSNALAHLLKGSHRKSLRLENLYNN